MEMLSELKGLVSMNIELGSKDNPMLDGLSQEQVKSEVEKQRKINVDLVNRWNRS